MKNSFLKKGLTYIPETLLLLGGIFYVLADLIHATQSVITILIIAGELGILALLTSKNKTLAFAISAVLGSASVLFMAALISEFMSFQKEAGRGCKCWGSAVPYLLVYYLYR